MKILVANAGSSSLKYQLIDMDNEQVIAKGLCDKIGLDDSNVSHKAFDGREYKANVKMPPAGHYGDAELEIGRVCVGLASPDFKYMNGETLTLEGGMGLRP